MQVWHKVYRGIQDCMSELERYGVVYLKFCCMGKCNGLSIPCPNDLSRPRLQVMSQYRSYTRRYCTFIRASVDEAESGIRKPGMWIDNIYREDRAWDIFFA